MPLTSNLLPSPQRPVLLHEAQHWDNETDIVIVGFGAGAATLNMQ